MDISTSKEERRFLPLAKDTGIFRAITHMTETADTVAPVNWSTGQTPLLELRDVNKSFGGLVAVGDLDLQVNQGEIISIIGPNGAGKTTVFNLITGIYRPMWLSGPGSFPEPSYTDENGWKYFYLHYRFKNGGEGMNVGLIIDKFKRYPTSPLYVLSELAKEANTLQRSA
jgi:ATPase subunit of ABC transporter with duplicated ATPase domains